MQVVYLDQNKWIELARAASGKANDPKLIKVLEVIRNGRDRGLAVFPLSLAHYMETHKQHDPQRRQELAALMGEVSQYTTIAFPATLLEHEIDVVLSRHFPNRVRIRPLNILGKGVSYAGDYPMERSLLHGPGFDRLTSEGRQAFEQWAKELMNYTLLSGVPQNVEVVVKLSGKEVMHHTLRNDIPAPKADLSEENLSFQRYIDYLHSLDPATRDRTIYANTMSDILDALTEALVLHGIAADEFIALGEQNWCALLDDMPTRRAYMHLQRWWAKNRTLKSNGTELNDWAYLGAAVCYCDIVVTEKLFADLIKRDGFQTHAKVITDMKELPSLLGPPDP